MSKVSRSGGATLPNDPDTSTAIKMIGRVVGILAALAALAILANVANTLILSAQNSGKEGKDVNVDMRTKVGPGGMEVNAKGSTSTPVPPGQAQDGHGTASKSSAPRKQGE